MRAEAGTAASRAGWVALHPLTLAVRAAWPGVALCVALALLATWLGALPWLRQYGPGTLVLALLLGAVLANLLPRRAGAPVWQPGVNLSRQQLLRLGIVLYGLRLSFQDLAVIGLDGVLVAALVLGSTFLLACLLGIGVLRMERDTVLLIGAGSSICGAAAVLATAPVLRARAEQVTVAVSTVVVFGTLATFVYPALFSSSLLSLTPAAFGLYVGSTVHEVAQVVAAAEVAGSTAVDAAVVAKMVRVMLLPAVLLALAVLVLRRAQQPRARTELPWFAFGFVLVVGVNSVLALPVVLVEKLMVFDTLLLTTAMAGLGLNTRFSALHAAGARPLLLAALLFAWLLAGGAWINQLV